jgi:putative spermidine/putrescine transport system substrate-binding protein
MKASPMKVASIVALALLAAPSIALAQSNITIVTWGGSVAKEMMEAWFKPATKDMSVRIREDSLKSPADLHSYSASGRTDWDVVDAATDMCERAGRDGLLEPLDFSVVKTDGLPKEQVTKWSVPSTGFVTVLAYNKKKYKDNPPKNWKDFFDVKNYPGTRFFGPFSTATLEVALLGDGVPPDKLYPLDVDRAFKKLAEFKPNITAFASSFGQSTQLMIDGEADMLYLPDNRAITAIRNGADYAITYNQGILNFDCLVIPKSSKNKPLAMKIVGNIVSPEINARIVESSGLSPANLLSVKNGYVPTKYLDEIGTGPVNFPKIVQADNGWWADNRAKLRLNERYNELKAK